MARGHQVDIPVFTGTFIPFVRMVRREVRTYDVVHAIDMNPFGFAAFAATFFMVIAFTQGLTLVTSLAAALLGSAVGFLIYNFSPSSIFMGGAHTPPISPVMCQPLA